MAVALAPTLLWSLYQAGRHSVGLLPSLLSGLQRVGPLLFACIVASMLVVLVVRRRVVGNAAIFGLLFGLTLRPDTPVLFAATAIVFGVFVGREIFGAAEHSFVHPAVLAHAFVVMTWPASVGEPMWLGDVSSAEAIAAASPVSCLFGAMVLVALSPSFSWRIVVAVPIGVAVGVALLGGGEGAGAVRVAEHVTLGTLAFGTIFLATDPNTSPKTRSARWFFGFLIGVLTVLFRLTRSGSPDGTMSAIFLASVFAPLADHVAQAGRVRLEARRG